MKNFEKNKIDNKVSVLITFYNQEDYVDRAVESVLAQETSFAYKVIIGDDGSTDTTIGKIKEWEDKYPDKITHIIQERNPDEKYIAGARASKNRLAILKMVDTPYFIFLDGDDFWTDENKLQKQYDILEKEENFDCIGCAHAIMAVNEQNGIMTEETVMPRFLKKEYKYSLQRYWSNYYFHTNTILFRSNNIANLDMKLLERFFNDNMITFAFLQFGSIYYLPDVMAVYCKNEKGLWAGEKKNINCFRDLLSYDITNLMNKNIMRISAIRYNGIFRYYEKNKANFINLPSIYKDLALTSNCKLSILASKGENLFYKNNIVNQIFIEWFHFCSLIRSFRKIILKK